jgi:hypothetical protein
MTREGRAFRCVPCRQFVVFLRSPNSPGEILIESGFADQLLAVDRTRGGVLGGSRD